MTPEIIKAQFPHTLAQAQIPALGRYYQGKVRDVYERGEQLVIITTDRVSAFDRVLGTIPFKGEMLNALAQAGFDSTQDIIPNAVLSRPDPNVFVMQKCTAYPVEWVVRAYVTGSLWRDIQAKTAEKAYDMQFPKHIKKDEALPFPVLTPFTKAENGQHDRPTSRRELIESNIMTGEAFDQAEATAIALFARGQALAQARGLILVDTKYELGLNTEGQLTLIDEVHTPDSSRYWVASEYETRLAAQHPQRMLDKENLRQWLSETCGFTGDGPPPLLTEDIRVRLCLRYAELYHQLLSQPFVPSVGSVISRLTTSLQTVGLLA
ncbi:MAG: phosphoribosylaminoimidazolesuccinocarboxamide synthase [Myxococcales bacterium]|nr:phosphoribosylaminoimidazolesuccinocarboxamide synthase [Myxococcales bacterium]